MKKRRLHVPIGLPISVVVLLILGAVANPVINAIFTEQQLSTNVILSAIPFVCIFAAIVLAFITLSSPGGLPATGLASLCFSFPPWVLSYGVTLSPKACNTPRRSAASRLASLSKATVKDNKT
jgi:hypothetical protein